MRVCFCLLLGPFLLACDDAEDATAVDAGSPDAAVIPDAAETPDAAVTPDAAPTRDAGPRPQVTLPADDAVHDEAVEWWYWTGHLRDEAGRAYGFQVTFFLFGAGDARATLSNVALTDLDADTFEYEANFAFAEPMRVDGGFDFTLEGHSAVGGDGSDHLRGDVPGATLDLQVDGGRPVLHHHDGHHAYGFGGYTFYYSRPRMTARGTLTVDGEARPVSGTAWFDHQWGDLTAATEVGWDWFALQLEDGRDVMLFLTRAEGPDALLGGTISDAEGVRYLGADAVSVQATGEWTSDETGCTWPSGWVLGVDGETFTVIPGRLDQEVVDTREQARSYWEGTCAVTGDATGRAYVELAGYCRD